MVANCRPPHTLLWALGLLCLVLCRILKSREDSTDWFGKGELICFRFPVRRSHPLGSDTHQPLNRVGRQCTRPTKHVSRRSHHRPTIVSRHCYRDTEALAGLRGTTYIPAECEPTKSVPGLRESSARAQILRLGKRRSLGSIRVHDSPPFVEW